MREIIVDLGVGHIGEDYSEARIVEGLATDAMVAIEFDEMTAVEGIGHCKAPT
jgi:hypothetical protein